MIRIMITITVMIALIIIKYDYAYDYDYGHAYEYDYDYDYQPLWSRKSPDSCGLQHLASAWLQRRNHCRHYSDPRPIQVQPGVRALRASWESGIQVWYIAVHLLGRGHTAETIT